MKIVASFPLIVNADGSVSLGAFEGGEVFMERLADVAREHNLPAGTQIRVAVEPVRTKGRYAKWAILSESAAGQITG